MRSLRAQDGEGFRIEDKYHIGVPDLLVKPKGLPGFLIEAKILHGAKLVCTPSQRVYLERFHDPPRFLTAIVGWSDSRAALYIGWPEDGLAECRFVPRPAALNSPLWLISELLGKWYHDEIRP